MPGATAIGGESRAKVAASSSLASSWGHIRQKDYLVRQHDPQIVRELDRAMRQGTYDEAIFERRCGKPVAALGAEWIKSLRKAR